MVYILPSVSATIPYGVNPVDPIMDDTPVGVYLVTSFDVPFGIYILPIESIANLLFLFPKV